MQICLQGFLAKNIIKFCTGRYFSLLHSRTSRKNGNGLNVVIRLSLYENILLSNLHLLSYFDIDTIIHALTFSLPQKSFNSLPLRGFLHHFLIWIIPQQIDSLLHIANRIGSCKLLRLQQQILNHLYVLIRNIRVFDILVSYSSHIPDHSSILYPQYYALRVSLKVSLWWSIFCIVYEIVKHFGLHSCHVKWVVQFFNVVTYIWHFF